MCTTLGLADLLPRFAGRILSAEDVARPKPEPDAFPFAAKQCQATPSQCVVIEDSPTGVRAAVLAGMTVFGYCALTPSDRLIAAGAHQLFSDMAELPDLLSQRSYAR